ncbi:hypothetical protein AMTR_s00010p00256680 [Amborella trichopoda]|uniref:FYVE-type domain-containing protein n=1 Tax=Amborella trichopoda TaxID=13333 RepID=W1NGS8_AMBTC|nr:hypothetical protein AMTR_s00010p00256680 [Amborella trichopoda]
MEAITALKKGAYLLKYGRRGKPKFCPFRLANDESILLWYSGKEEKQLKLSQVSRIIPGQRTSVSFAKSFALKLSLVCYQAYQYLEDSVSFEGCQRKNLAIFQRYPRPEKEYQSFSLIYNDRSLDLICKDKDEAEVWFVGLKALISRGTHRKWRIESRSDRASSDTNSPSTYTRRNSPLGSPYDVGDNQSGQSPYDSPPRNGIGKAFSDVILFTAPPIANLVIPFPSGSGDNSNGHMRISAADNFRVSLSSVVSSSSQGSGHEDFDALGDVFLWGEATGEGLLGGGIQRLGSSSGAKMDSLLPKALESAVVLDVHNIACGSRHATLVTKQGEVFSWGEESGGRLGHGIEADVAQPKLVDALSGMNVELVACGEYHTCAVTMAGDLYTWGDGTHNFGLLGHGTEVSHWVPKRVSGPLEGIHVSSISCGPWHTAVVTSAGQLFTFGDGTFGALGHGDRACTSTPREVESLKGLRTMRVACGVWHTAAIVEIIVGSSSSSNTSSGKLFTWGDGDKGRLGHGDKEPKVIPTCVASLVEPNFCQVACGHSLTIALTTSGRVYTMGSTVYGQLGNPHADGKLPTCVEGKIRNSFVEEITCGAYHVAVLTSRTEVYTWGKGANGRLGHGDTDDRNTPTLVEALRDKQVKSVVCGSNFTAVICLHKWVSCADQSICSGCHLPFGFRRKRHNCYNCGLVFCNACSGKKSLKASLAPNINKPYRVCDDCYLKLKKAIEAGSVSRFAGNRSGSLNHRSYEAPENGPLDSKSHAQLSRLSSMESFKHVEGRSVSKRNRKLESNSNRVSPIPNGNNQWESVTFSRSLNPVFGSSKKIFSASVPGSRIVSRATSPVSRRPSPPRSTTPTPTMSGLASPRAVVEGAKQTNDSLSQEVVKLRVQVENLTRKSQLQEVELEKATKELKDAQALAREESEKCKAAKDVIKSLTAQLKDMAERLGEGKIDGPVSVSSHTSNNLGLTSNENHLSSAIAHDDADSNGSSNLHSSNENKAPALGEWVEQDEPGVYITLTSLPGGAKDLKRVRFSRKRFSEREAEKWWAENRARVYEKYRIRSVERPDMGPASMSGRTEHEEKT